MKEEIKVKYGVSYYPEHKEQLEINHDIELMRELGIDFVRMGEFAWCKFEPIEGQYEFHWLDDVIDQMAENGIQSILCTPTACPPAWLVEKHPQILYVDNRGVTRPFGGRRSYCYNNPIYREYSQKIAEKMGEHYGDNPNVIAFQIDNELAQEATGRCHCEVCQRKFQDWLEEKYGTINNLNAKIGTIFWGQTYNHFGQINMPVNTIEVNATQAINAHHENPSLRLDFERFCSDSNIDYQNIQLDALKKHTDKIVTTNATGIATNSIDYYKAFKTLDVHAFDYYPSLRDLEISSFPYSFARGICNKDFWLLEFVSGGGHRLGGSGRLQQYPGALQQSVMHAFASGAELVAHFQFRTFPYGAEQLNYAIVDADGIPRRRFHEVKSAAQDIKRLDDVLNNSRIINEVAICVDYDVLWALRIKPISRDFRYLNFCQEIYHELLKLGVGVDVISYNQDIDKYKAVIVPTPTVMSEEFKNRLKQYVKNGGVLLSTFLAGLKNEYNTGISQSLPCGMTALFGIRVGEVEPVVERTVSRISLQQGNSEIIGTNKYWTETLEENGAEIIGVYEDTFRKGIGVISKNSYGHGKAYYLGTGLVSDLLSEFLKVIVQDGQVTQVPFQIEDGVEIIVRKYKGKKVYCIFNFLKKKVYIKLDATFTDILNEQVVNQTIEIEPKGYVFLMD